MFTLFSRSPSVHGEKAALSRKITVCDGSVFKRRHKMVWNSRLNAHYCPNTFISCWSLLFLATQPAISVLKTPLSLSASQDHLSSVVQNQLDLETLQVFKSILMLSFSKGTSGCLDSCVCLTKAFALTRLKSRLHTKHRGEENIVETI